MSVHTIITAMIFLKEKYHSEMVFTNYAIFIDNHILNCLFSYCVSHRRVLAMKKHHYSLKACFKRRTSHVPNLMQMR